MTASPAVSSLCSPSMAIVAVPSTTKISTSRSSLTCSGGPAPSGPRQQRRVQVLRCLPPDGAAASALRLGGGVELGRGEPFDQREQLPLLEADVGLEPLAELAHDRPDVGAALERADECVELLVVEQGLDEQRSPPATRRRVGRAGGSSRISAVVGEGELDRLIERQ
jgi:hypothetical protein